MKIISDNVINFNAKLIKSIRVEKYNGQKNQYYPEQVYFVEAEPDNPEDSTALGTAADYWVNEKYAAVIAHTSKLLNMKILDKNQYKVYAVTTQKDNLSNLDDRQILGMAEIEDAGKPVVELSHIQVKPEIIYALENPEYKKLGTGILNALKSLYSGIKLTSADSKSVINFYLKNDFKRLIPNTNRFIWLRK